MSDLGMDHQEYCKKRKEFKPRDYVSRETMINYSVITMKCKNTNITLSVARQIDQVFRNGWYLLDDKDANTLICLVHYIYSLYAVLVGTFLADRLILHAKKILLNILDTQAAELTHDQMKEISGLLQFEPIKSLEKILVKFDLTLVEVKKQLVDHKLTHKIMGLRDLQTMFGRTENFTEQLKMFSLKMQPLIKECLANHQLFEQQKHSPEFLDFIKELKDLMLCVICDSQFTI